MHEVLASSRTIIDAKKPVSLVVTSKHVKNAVKKDPANCAYALCVKEALHADEALIFRTRAYVRTGERWTRYVVPNSVARELIVLDRGGEMEPGTYRLLAVPESSKLGAGHARSPQPSTRAGRKEASTGRNRPPKVVHHRMKEIRVELTGNLYERLGV
jgi:hypothetical protein